MKKLSSFTIIIFVFLCISATKAQIFTKIELPESISVINDIEIEKDSIVWIASNKGLIKLIDNKFTIIKDTNKALFKINTIWIDKNNTKWLGTYNLSVIQFLNEQDYNEIKLEPNNKSPHLITSINHTDDFLYITSSEPKIYEFNILTKKIDSLEKPTETTIYSIIKDPETENIWISSIDGLYQKKKRNRKWKSKEDFLVAYGIYKRNNQYWAAGRNAKNLTVLIYLFEDNKIFNKSIKFWKKMILNNLPNPYTKFNDLDFGSEDIIWIASNDGLIKYDPITAKCEVYNSNTHQKFPIKTANRLAILNNNTIYVSNKGSVLYKIEF